MLGVLVVVQLVVYPTALGLGHRLLDAAGVQQQWRGAVALEAVVALLFAKAVLGRYRDAGLGWWPIALQAGAAVPAACWLVAGIRAAIGQAFCCLLGGTPPPVDPGTEWRARVAVLILLADLISLLVCCSLPSKPATRAGAAEPCPHRASS